MRGYLIYILLIITLLSNKIYAANIGLVAVATGKYTVFVKPLLESARKHFCKGHNVTFFIFTDGKIEEEKDIVSIYHPRFGWPYDTMMRYQAYSYSADLLLTQDYIFATDIDMLFVDDIGDEILSERVATLHPGFVHQRGSYENNPHSLAYVSPYEGQHYFAGGFYGGTAKEVIKIANTNLANIYSDLKNGIIAEWHDESHWNRYCIDNKPTLILSPSYCYPESWNLPYKKRLLCLDKNHGEFQIPL